jgi:hypothetical protein
MMPGNAPLLPWSNKELEALLSDLIDHGVETPKADCKAEIDTKTNEGKADLLKDISAIANTYALEFNDYGFLIYGVAPKAITGVTTTQTDTDKLQSHIEELLKVYLSPMPQIYVIGFTAAQGQQWGVIVIPPRNTKPHMFAKDLQCGDAKKSRKRGDWFVRRGSTNDVGLPEDLAVITQRQTELMLEPLRESIRSLQLRVAKTEDQYNSALFRLVESAFSLRSEGRTQPADDQGTSAETISSDLLPNLPARLKQRLRTPADTLASDLLAAALTLREFLEGGNSRVPWDPQSTDADADANRVMIETLEERTGQLVASFATILLDDKQGAFTGALLQIVKILARTGPPSGVRSNLAGPAVRDYPLVLLLYTAFVCGIQARDVGTLKRLLDIPLRHRGGGRSENILYVFSYARRAKELFNTALGGRWCEPIIMRVRPVLSDRVGDMLAGVDEPEYFFRGEFALALTLIDRGITQKTPTERIAPLPGLYLYLTEANNAIRDFMSEHPDWLAGLYSNPLVDVLGIFDSNCSKAVSRECISAGLSDLKVSALYQRAATSGV